MKITKPYLLVTALLLASPIFLVASELTGYHEPLDIVAEALGLKEATEEFNWTPFLDYTVPGVPPVLGYILTGALGVIAILALCKLVEKVRGR